LAQIPSVRTQLAMNFVATARQLFPRILVARE
jgi:hypothetical protein